MMRIGQLGVTRRLKPRCRALVALLAWLSGVWIVFGPAVGVAHGSVALLLEMPYGEMGTFNPTGHAALYFDHICAASPVTLRPCGPGELGVVISRYDGIGEVDWVAMPLVPYLYSVKDAADIPQTVDRLSALRLRDLYRRQYLESVAPDTPDGGMPQGNWYELVGSAFDRTIYGFQVKTTPEQDESIEAYFDDRPNVTRYSGAFRNCADFARVVLDRLYPHAVRRNLIADFGLTTPKSVARSLVHYGRKHPEAELETFRVPQVDGSIPRSVGIQGVTGSLLTRYGVPMTILSPHLTAVVLVAYVGKGRFAVPKHAPVLDVAELQEKALAGEARTLEADRNGTGIARGGQLSLALDGRGPAPLGVGWVPAMSISAPGCDVCDASPFLP